MKSVSFGRNLKWNVRPEHFAIVRRMLTEVFGGTSKTPRPNLEVFTLAGGENIGVFVDPEALDTDHAMKGAWLEFFVDDVDGATKSLEAAGVARLDYEDKDAPYFQAPGAPVFRLSKG
jgi:hypothetical protein